MLPAKPADSNRPKLRIIEYHSFTTVQTASAGPRVFALGLRFERAECLKLAGRGTSAHSVYVSRPLENVPGDAACYG